jgi:transketolase
VGGSLLDRVDLWRIREAAAGGGPSAALVASLVIGGAFAFDPRNAAWADRDRLTVGSPGLVPLLAAAVGGAAAGQPWWGPYRPGAALAVACGAAIGSRLDGGVFRSWCLLDDAAADDGGVWEAARAAADAEDVPLIAGVACQSARAREGVETLFRAAGWPVFARAATDLGAVVAALDRALALEEPTAVVVR